MLVLIAYDVCTASKKGVKRLAKVAKICVNYGQRVQNSVFECKLDAAQLKFVKHELLKIIDPEADSIRFYNLGDKYNSKIEHYGVSPGYDPGGILML